MSNKTFKYNDFEGTFDCSNPDDLTRYEAACTEFGKFQNDLPKNESPSVQLKASYGAMIAFLDSVLGRGSAEKMVTTASLTDATDAIFALFDFIKNQASENEKRWKKKMNSGLNRR